MFESTTLAPPAPAQQPAAPEDGGDRRRRLTLVAAVIGVVVLVLAAAWMLLRPSGSSTSQQQDKSFIQGQLDAAKNGKPGAAAKTTGSKAPAKKPAVTTPKPAPKTFDDVLGRNPFTPLYTPPTTPPSTAPASAPVGAPAPAPATGTTGTSTGTATQPAVAQPTWIELDTQNGVKTATFRVGYSDGVAKVFQNVAAPTGNTPTKFGDYFALLSLETGKATVQMGDGKPFTLEQGYSNRHPLV